MSGPIVHNGPPEWVTPEIGRRMAEQVVMACAEAGYPDVTFSPTDLFDGRNYSFAGAPDDVLTRAGQLVRQHWGIT